MTVAGARVAVVGAGAAARSVVDALGRAGTGEVIVVNRTATRRGGGRDADTRGPRRHGGDVAAVDIVVNATSVGLGSDELPLDPALLRPGQVVADLVYHPLETALLQAAAAAGCRVVDGLGMLVHQAVCQQVLWTGLRPDPAIIRAAADAELARRATPA